MNDAEEDHHKTVETVPTGFAAVFLTDMLRENGVEGVSQIDTPAGIKIQVPVEFVERARALIAESSKRAKDLLG